MTATTNPMAEIRARILAADDIRREPANTSEWNVDGLYLQGLSSVEWKEFQKSHLKMKPGEKEPTFDADGAAEDLVRFGLVDSEGNKVFPDPEDVKLLATKNVGVLMRLSTRVTELTGMSDAAVEAEAKNSHTSTGSDS